MPNRTVDKHFALRQSPDSKAATDSSFLRLEEISSCSGGRNSILTPHFQQGFHLLCQLSAQNVSCLSDQSFQLCPWLSTFIPESNVLLPHQLKCVFCELCNLNNGKYCWCVRQVSFSHTAFPHWTCHSQPSAVFCPSLRCHIHFALQWRFLEVWVF